MQACSMQRQRPSTWVCRYQGTWMLPLMGCRCSCMAWMASTAAGCLVQAGDASP
jgi:hypothetical protein